MFSYRHAKFQAPLARMRSTASSLWRTGWALAGKYKPLSAEEQAFEFGDAVPFKGDVPVRAGADHHQRRLSFQFPRPLVEEVENLVVTPAGAGWKNGALYERYSSCRPGLRMLLGETRPQSEIPTGYFVQSEHMDTFGDWMAEYLSPLSLLDDIAAPVLLPQALARKPYVQRDAARVGIDVIEVDAPILVRKAMVVQQQRCIRYWQPKDVQALRAFLNVDAPTPSPGSILYLSRHGEASEVADRTHPNEMIERIVRERGGVVLRTAEADFSDYLNAAHSAETVLFDHGSAAYNMIHWRPRKVIEFVSDAWWMNSFLFFADAGGVHDYSIVCTDQGTPDDLRKKVYAALDEPLSSAA
jgi:hypothetical protein